MMGAAIQCNATFMRLALATVALVLAMARPPHARAQGGFQGSARYEITNVKSGKAVGLDPYDRTTVLQFPPRRRESQLWEIRAAEPGFWFIRNVMTRGVLEAMGMANGTPVRGKVFNGGPSQQWRIAPGKNGTALITNRLGKTLEIPNGTTLDGASVQTYKVNGDASQRFWLRRVGVRSN